METYNYSAKFTGVGEIRIPVFNDLPTGNNSRSIKFTLTSTENNDTIRAICSYGGATAGTPLFFIYLQNGRIKFEAGSKNYFMESDIISDGKLHECVISFDNNSKELFMYVDDILAQSHSNCTLATSSSDLVIGSLVYRNDYFIGEIFEFRMWNKFLDINQINSDNTEIINIDFSSGIIKNIGTSNVSCSVGSGITIQYYPDKQKLTFHKTLSTNLPEKIEAGKNEIHFTEDGGIFINDKEGNLKQCNAGEIVREINNPLTTSDMSEESPVGNIISIASTEAPSHYLICDGSEYNVSDYPYLVEHLKENLGGINCFGGDGVNTFAVPNIEKSLLNIIDYVPKMSSNTSSDLVKITSSGCYSGSYEYYAFDNSSSTGWFANTNPESATNCAWIQCQFLDEAKKINTVQLRNYSYGGYCRCKDFILQGSNDGIIYDDLVTGTLPNDESKYSIFEVSDQQKYSYIRIKAISNYGPSGIYNFGLGDIKIQFAIPSISCIKCEPIHFAVNQYGGFEAQVLFDGKANTLNSVYSLSDSIQNYSFLYVYCSADGTTENSESIHATTYIINIDDIVFGRSDQFLYNISNGSASRMLLYSFIDEKSFKITNTVFNAIKSMQVAKVIGIKGQLPSLLCGGEF